MTDAEKREIQLEAIVAGFYELFEQLEESCPFPLGNAPELAMHLFNAAEIRPDIHEYARLEAVYEEEDEDEY